MFTLRVAKAQPEYVTYKERYKVDLPLQMAECEANYVRLSKLVAREAADEIRFIVTTANQPWLHLLKITERSPYTTTLELSRTAMGVASEWLSMPKLTLRMYHDAKLAEVLAWEGHKRLRPRYDYPNQSMYQSDEKYQLNRFLGEWLNLCLAQGHDANELAPF
ncbi:hypothetical protein CBP51_14415 [Cellvibrio mixtus]|jgi:uncharacterized protein YqiB (DUF1249 family)|uniref:Cytoplasmic protein n=1 Tax=Cellvibrio mixtus TaxID=39650 RepID=A0A266Q4U5_9GAMM|nr:MULTISPECIES: DUF1249 domain-containing protein [Cellvibrio]AQT58909.1 hypothetical protein B0D95_01485 [Cellvibrio sp. PSBB023]OZY84401.1 hypothetical protein CBP51_14415 [Cellvibrio mixtus]